MPSVAQAQNAIDNFKKPETWDEKNYQLVLRKFKTGQVEVVTKAVRAMQRYKAEERWDHGGPPLRSGSSDEELSESEKEARRESNKDRAIRRARQSVRWAVKSIAADHLLTLTYRTKDDKPMDCLERLKADWDRFRRLVKKGLPSSNFYGAHKGLQTWQFVAVREQQENGAWHLHVALVGRQDVNFLRRCWFVAIGGGQDDKGAATLGNIDVRGPAKKWGNPTTEWKSEKLAGYMCKYMHKLFEEIDEKGAKRYWAARCNDTVEPVKIWLAAADFVEAVRQTFAHAKAAGSGYCKLWYSECLDVIWTSG